MQEGETHNLPDVSKAGGKHSTSRLPEVMDVPRCNNADIDWYMRMPTDPPPIDANMKCFLNYVRKKVTLWNQPFP